ncbi:retention module-containing protein, partial [Shewanella sp. E94]
MKTIVTTQPGTILLAEGDVKLKLENSSKAVSQGQLLPVGSTLTFEDIANINILYSDNTHFEHLASTNQISKEEEEEAAVRAPNLTDAQEVKAIQDAIASGEDPTIDLPETAAGESSGNEGGSDLVSLARTANETIASTGFNTNSTSQSNFAVTNNLNETTAENQSNLL